MSKTYDPKRDSLSSIVNEMAKSGYYLDTGKRPTKNSDATIEIYFQEVK